MARSIEYESFLYDNQWMRLQDDGEFKNIQTYKANDAIQCSDSPGYLLLLVLFLFQFWKRGQEPKNKAIINVRCKTPFDTDSYMYWILDGAAFLFYFWFIIRQAQ